ncbi:MAG: helicase HerA-like domain-containing protein [Candidatus Woesearchaeota archaeon]
MTNKKTSKSKKSASQSIQSNTKKSPSFILGTSDDKPLWYKADYLKKHFIALGASGSGKTVLSKVLLEEAAVENIPSLVIDVQGDLSALALIADEKDLKDKNIDIKRYNKFKENTSVTVFTPISKKGIPLCINPLQLRASEIPQSEQVPIIHEIASSFSRLLGYDTSKDSGKFAQALLYETLLYCLHNNIQMNTFEELIIFLEKPPEELEEKISLLVADTKELSTLIRKIRFLTVGEKKLLFQQGVAADIDILLGKDKKSKRAKSKHSAGTKEKTQISIIYMNTLHSQEEKEFFLANITNKLYQWMLSNPSTDVQACLMIDEIAPFIPAGSKKPMTKDVLKLIFKQARKYGVGCVIATQNPGDIDYKAFAQFGTWALGRLTLAQDIKKVDQALKSLTGSHSVKSTLPQLHTGEFVLFAPDMSSSLINLKTRWLYTKHKTLDEDDIEEIMNKQRKEFESLYLKKTSYSQANVSESKNISSKKRSNQKIPKEITKKILEQEKQNKELVQITKKNIQDDSVILQLTQVFLDEAMNIAKNHRKKKLFGQNETVQSISEHKQHILRVTLQQEQKKFFRKNKLKELIMFIDATNGEILTCSKQRIKRNPFTKNIILLSENQQHILHKLSIQKKPLSITEIAHETQFTKETVSSNLKVLEKEGFVIHQKRGRYKNYHTTHKELSQMEDLASTNSQKVISKTITKTKDIKKESQFDFEELISWANEWFEAVIAKVEHCMLTNYHVTYTNKKESRTAIISGYDGTLTK